MVWLLDKAGGYREKVLGLMAKHELAVDGATASEAVDALAKRVMFTHRNIAQEVRSKGRNWQVTGQLRKAMNQSLALINNKGDAAKHEEKLKTVLTDPRVAVELAVQDPPILVDQIVAELDAHTISEQTLIQLERSLQKLMRDPRTRTGRPTDFHSPLFFSIIRVWTLGGNQPTYSNNAGVLKGKFVDFLRDVYELCGVSPPSDEAIHSRVTALRKRHDFST